MSNILEKAHILSPGSRGGEFHISPKTGEPVYDNSHNYSYHDDITKTIANGIPSSVDTENNNPRPFSVPGEGQFHQVGVNKKHGYGVFANEEGMLHMRHDPEFHTRFADLKNPRKMYPYIHDADEKGNKYPGERVPGHPDIHHLDAAGQRQPGLPPNAHRLKNITSEEIKHPAPINETNPYGEKEESEGNFRKVGVVGEKYQRSLYANDKGQIHTIHHPAYDAEQDNSANLMIPYRHNIVGPDYENRKSLIKKEISTMENTKNNEKSYSDILANICKSNGMEAPGGSLILAELTNDVSWWMQHAYALNQPVQAPDSTRKAFWYHVIKSMYMKQTVPGLGSAVQRVNTLLDSMISKKMGEGMGSRGGKWYLNSKGNQVYGAPPGTESSKADGRKRYTDYNDLENTMHVADGYHPDVGVLERHNKTGQLFYSEAGKFKPYQEGSKLNTQNIKEWEDKTKKEDDQNRKDNPKPLHWTGDPDAGRFAGINITHP